MEERVQVGGLSVAEALYRFVTEEALPGSGVEPRAFWAQAEDILTDLAPRNRQRGRGALAAARRQHAPADDERRRRTRAGHDQRAPLHAPARSAAAAVLIASRMRG